MSRISKPLSKLCLVAISLAIPLASIFSAPTVMAAPAAARAVSGQTVSDPNCIQPPTNVDHATFTDAQLDLYGLPHRAKGEPLAQWQQAVRSARHRMCTQIVTGLPVGPATHNEGSNIWAGNIAIGGGYTEAMGQWNVPCLTLLLENGDALEWVGIGGDGNDGGGNLVQSGTNAQEYSDFPGHWTAQYYAWIEDYPWNPTVIEKFGVSCGDPMYADDWQTYSNGNPTAAYMYIGDLKTGQYAESVNTNAFSNGSTAEWIIERPNGGGWGTTNLADFNYVNYTDDLGCLGAICESPINLSHNYSTMPTNGHDLVSVGPLYADSGDSGAHFTMTFLHPN